MWLFGDRHCRHRNPVCCCCCWLELVEGSSGALRIITVEHLLWLLVWIILLSSVIGIAATCAAQISPKTVRISEPTPRQTAAVPGGRVNPAAATMLS